MELSRKAQAIEPSLTLAITAKAKEMKEKGIDVHRPVCAHHPFTDQYVGGHGGAGPRQLQPGPGQERAEACKA